MRGRTWRRAVLGGRSAVLLFLVVLTAGGCTPDYAPQGVVLGTTTATVRLTPEQPVAVADLVVGAAGRGSTVSVSVDNVPVRVASFDLEHDGPRFIDEGHNYSEARIGTMSATDQALRRHVMVWIDDPARLPADVEIATSVVAEVTGEVPSNLADSVPVSAEWTAAGQPSDVSAVASGEFRIAAGETVAATLDLHFAPAAAVDRTALVPTWVIDATIDPDDPAGGTADMLVQPGTTGFRATLFSPGIDFRSIYQPDTITCSSEAQCDLHYDLTFEGRDPGTVRWQVTAELVDFTGDAPLGRDVDIAVDGIPSAPEPLDTPWRSPGGAR